MPNISCECRTCVRGGGRSPGEFYPPDASGSDLVRLRGTRARTAQTAEAAPCRGCRPPVAPRRTGCAVRRHQRGCLHPSLKGSPPFAPAPRRERERGGPAVRRGSAYFPGVSSRTRRSACLLAGHKAASPLPAPNPPPPPPQTYKSARVGGSGAGPRALCETSVW